MRLHPFTVLVFEAALAVALFRTTTPAAAQSYTQPSCACGPSAMPAYQPPYPVPAPRPAVRPLDGSLRSGVTYREGATYQTPRTNLGTSYFEPVAGPALWAGLYAGVHGGYGVGQSNIRSPQLGSTSTSGGFGGAHLGYNWQSSAIVWGLEADIGRGFASGQRNFGSGFNVSSSREWMASARARVGVSIGRVLAYGTVGGAVASETVTASAGGMTWRGPETHLGYVYGGGLEWQATNRIVLRGEVLRYEFNERTMHVGGTTAPLKLDDTVVRGGLSFRLN